MPSDYYLKQSDKLLGRHRQMMAIGEPLLAERFNAEVAADLIQDAVSEFKGLLPVIPYIGGKKNPMTDTLVQMTSMLALYRTLKEHMPVEEIGELAYQMALAWIKQYPRLFRYLIGRYYMSGYMQRRKQKQAAVSQEQNYPGDFVPNMLRSYRLTGLILWLIMYFSNYLRASGT